MTIRVGLIEALEQRGCHIIGTPGHYIKMSRPDRKDWFWYLGRNGGLYVGCRMENLIALERDNAFMPLRVTNFLEF